jgi:hypothetical protein
LVVEFKCRKCGTVVSHEEYNKSRFCPNCGTFLSSGKSSLSTSSGLTHAEMIADVIKDLQEPFTRQQVIKAVVEKYSSVRLIDKESLGTDIAGCCINLKSHDSLPNLPFLLVAVGRGLYRRYEPRKDNSQVIDYANLKTPTISRTERVQGELIQDVEKAKEIGAVLHTQFSTKTGFFKNYEMPEYVLPNNIEEGSLEHARYLTFIISIDYQTDAAELWRNARST